MIVPVAQLNQSQRARRKGFHNDFAKFTICVVALALTADAFQSNALRSLPSQKLMISGGLARRLDFINFRQQKSIPNFVKRLRATATLDSEAAYIMAQACHRENFEFQISLKVSFTACNVLHRWFAGEFQCME